MDTAYVCKTQLHVHNFKSFKYFTIFYLILNYGMVELGSTQPAMDLYEHLFIKKNYVQSIAENTCHETQVGRYKNIL